MYHSISFWPADSDTGYKGIVNGMTQKDVFMEDGNFIYREIIDCLPIYSDFKISDLLLTGINSEEGVDGTRTKRYLKYIKTIYLKLINPDTNEDVNKKELKMPTSNSPGPIDISVPEFLYGYNKKMIIQIEIDKDAITSFPFDYAEISFKLIYKEKLTEDKFIGNNTWASWRMIPTSRPVISPPSPKLSYQQVPYSSGNIDLSEFGVSDVTFDNRGGSGEFIVMNDMIDGYDKSTLRVNDGNTFSKMLMPEGKAEMWDWDKTYSTVLDTIHGKRMKVVLEDDPAYCYTGRVAVEGLNSEEHWSKININMDLLPYKQERFSTSEEWLWDAIDFEANIDVLGLKNIILKPNDIFEYKFKTLRNRIYPVITISHPANVDNIFITAYISDRSTNKTRIIPLRSGTNKYDTEYGNIYSLNDLYFEGNSDIVFTLINNTNDANAPAITVTIDFKLEGL